MLKIALIIFTLSASMNTFAQSQVYIKMGEAKTKKSLVAFPSFQFIGSPTATPKNASLGAELYRVIANDLDVSTFFQLIPESAFLEKPNQTSPKPYPTDPNGFRFESWKQIGAEFLIRGSFTIAGTTLSLEAYSYHVSRGDLIFARKYNGEISNLRKIAHTFANDFLEQLTGKKGMFLSRVVVASNRGVGQFKEIFVMDWDGANVEKVSQHNSIALSPAWSIDGSRIAYTAFVRSKKTKKRNADLFMYELGTGKRWLVSYRIGMNSGAFFNPDGSTLLLTLSQGGTADIYKMNFEGDLVGKLTNGPYDAMNVEPAMSPDGKTIAFSSDRSGQPMIWTMSSGGGGAQRLTFAGKYNSTPAWSPDGKKIAFAGWLDNHFDIFVMNSDKTNLIRITSASKPNGRPANNEDPVFSSDGRLLMYTSDRSGHNQIYISNLDGSEERRITADNYDYFKPKWSINIE